MFSDSQMTERKISNIDILISLQFITILKILIIVVYFSVLYNENERDNILKN
jgi:hypothetical protein